MCGKIIKSTCPVDGKDSSVVGDMAYDPEAGAHILTADDVR
ncbi:hypothetical protein [Nonomuraea fuscirosea]